METRQILRAQGGRGGADGGEEVHRGLFNLFIQLIYKLFAANGHKWGAEAGNKILDLENGVISLRVH